MSEMKVGSFVNFCFTNAKGASVNYPVARVESFLPINGGKAIYTIGLDLASANAGRGGSDWIAAKKEEVSLLEDQGAAQAMWELQNE